MIARQKAKLTKKPISKAAKKPLKGGPASKPASKNKKTVKKEAVAPKSKVVKGKLKPIKAKAALVAKNSKPAISKKALPKNVAAKFKNVPSKNPLSKKTVEKLPKIVLKKSSSKTTSVEALASKPAKMKPVAMKPVAMKPVANKPVAIKPVAIKPVASKSIHSKFAPAIELSKSHPIAILKSGSKLDRTAKNSPIVGSLAPATKLLKPAKPMAPPRPIITGPATNPKIVEKIRGLQESREQRKDLAQPPTSRSVLIPNTRAADQPRDPNKDRLVLMVRDPFWLHACWDITRKSVERAKSALAGNWHTARPMLRLLRAEDSGTTSNTENVYRDIEIHGGVRHWYIETESHAATFRLLLGYLYGNNRFHELARSNPVTTPVPGSPDSTDDHWADLSKDAERIYALSGGSEDDTNGGELQQMMQEKLKRPIGTPSLTQFGSGAEGSLRRMKNFHLDLDAEMVVFGTTHPHAILTVAGEPVQIRSDGTFTARVPLPNNRQVLAATSKSRDGLDEQTIVLAVERNTKIMERLSSSEPDE